MVVAHFRLVDFLSILQLDQTFAGGLFKLRGRRLTENRLPNLLADLKNIVDSQSQTDPKFKTNRLYTRISAAEVRRQLIAQKGYSEEELPSEETIRTRLNKLGYYPSKVGKTKPLKKLK